MNTDACMLALEALSALEALRDALYTCKYTTTTTTTTTTRPTTTTTTTTTTTARSTYFRPYTPCLKKRANHGLILMIFSKQHSHMFKNDVPIQLSLYRHFTYFICFQISK